MLGHRPEHHVLLPTLTKLGATMKNTVNATTATHFSLTKPCLSVFMSHVCMGHRPLWDMRKRHKLRTFQLLLQKRGSDSSPVFQ